jgi:lysozyme
VSELDRVRLAEQLDRHEGRRQKPYKDTVGKLTIGVGRNLDDVGLFDDEIDRMLANDIERAVRGLVSRYPSWFPSLDPVRQAVLVNMAFMGLSRLAGFTKMLTAVARHDFETAAIEMLQSKWADQVGDRALELAQMMRTGTWV